jgi:hypothetical protein
MESAEGKEYTVRVDKDAPVSPLNAGDETEKKALRESIEQAVSASHGAGMAEDYSADKDETGEALESIMQDILSVKPATKKKKENKKVIQEQAEKPEKEKISLPLEDLFYNSFHAENPEEAVRSLVGEETGLTQEEGERVIEIYRALSSIPTAPTASVGTWLPVLLKFQKGDHALSPETYAAVRAWVYREQKQLLDTFFEIRTDRGAGIWEKDSRGNLFRTYDVLADDYLQAADTIREHGMPGEEIRLLQNQLGTVNDRNGPFGEHGRELYNMIRQRVGSHALREFEKSFKVPFGAEEKENAEKVIKAGKERMGILFREGVAETLSDVLSLYQFLMEYSLHLHALPDKPPYRWQGEPLYSPASMKAVVLDAWLLLERERARSGEFREGEMERIHNLLKSAERVARLLHGRIMKNDQEILDGFARAEHLFILFSGEGMREFEGARGIGESGRGFTLERAATLLVERKKIWTERLIQMMAELPKTPADHTGIAYKDILKVNSVVREYKREMQEILRVLKEQKKEPAPLYPKSKDAVLREAIQSFRGIIAERDRKFQNDIEELRHELELAEMEEKWRITGDKPRESERLRNDIRRDLEKINESRRALREILKEPNIRTLQRIEKAKKSGFFEGTDMQALDDCAEKIKTALSRKEKDAEFHKAIQSFEDIIAERDRKFQNDIEELQTYGRELAEMQEKGLIMGDKRRESEGLRNDIRRDLDRENKSRGELMEIFKEPNILTRIKKAKNSGFFDRADVKVLEDCEEKVRKFLSIYALSVSIGAKEKFDRAQILRRQDPVRYRPEDRKKIPPIAEKLENEASENMKSIPEILKGNYPL